MWRSLAFERQLERSRAQQRTTVATRTGLAGHALPPTSHVLTALGVLLGALALLYGFRRYRSAGHNACGCACLRRARPARPPTPPQAEAPQVNFDISFVNNEVEVTPWDEELDDDGL